MYFNFKQTVRLGDRNPGRQDEVANFLINVLTPVYCNQVTEL